MVDKVVELLFNLVLWTAHGICLFYQAKEDFSDRDRKKRSLSQLSSSKYPRAVLITSNLITFGNDCERLVNIAFQTSQSFPTLMGTCANISRYLRKELAQQYPEEYFHIIIGENQKFGFSVDDSQYYAEIEQDQYRVLIFATKQNPHIKSDTHDANSQMILKWK
jgi:hypothetical protein